MNESERLGTRWLGLEAGDEVRYVYDMGDYWEIRLRVEAGEDAPEVEAEEEEEERRCSPPVVCLDGAWLGPLEDCGGPIGFGDLLAALRDPGHRDHRGWRAWVGPDYDPEEFSTDAANGELAALFGSGGEAAAAPLPTQVTEAVGADHGAPGGGGAPRGGRGPPGRRHAPLPAPAGPRDRGRPGVQPLPRPGSPGVRRRGHHLGAPGLGAPRGTWRGTRLPAAAAVREPPRLADRGLLLPPGLDPG